MMLNNPLKALKNPWERIMLKMQMVQRFYEHINVKKFDIINAHDVLSAGLKGEKMILTLHGYYTELFDYNDIIITVDTRLKNYVIDNFNYPEEKVVVIHNAVDTEMFFPVTKREQIDLKRKLKFSDKWVILIPRRFVPKNGVLYAAEALKLIKRRDIIFVFAGQGILERDLRNILEGDDRAIITRIPHEIISDYYKASDIILIPSVTSNDVEEATSLAMLEGMACGKIVIATNVGGMREVIKDNINGFIIPQKSPEAIAEKIEYAIKHYEDLESIY